MRFKYGAFFGVTAVHTMFMSKAQIDRLFSISDMKTSALTLVESLLKEVCALKQILSGKPLDGVSMPYVNLTPDYSSDYAVNLTNGLNLYLQNREQNLAAADIGADDDLDALFEESDTYSKKPVTSATNVFSDEDSSLDLDMLVDTKDTSGGLDISFLFDAQPERTSYDIGNLVEYGASGEVCLNPRIAAPRHLKRFMMQNSNQFSREEKDAIMSQIAKIPCTPTACSLPTGLLHGKAQISPDSLFFLQQIFAQSNEIIYENVPRIDYLIQKLGLLLFKSTGDGKALFFAPKDKFQSGDSSWISYNNFLHNLCDKYLSDDSKPTTLTNISFLLDDCDTVLGIANPEIVRANEQLDLVRGFIYNTEDGISQTRAVEAIMELVDAQHMTLHERDTLKSFVYQLISSGSLLQSLLEGTGNLKYVLTSYAIIDKVISQNMYTVLGLEKYMAEDTEITCASIQHACADLFLSFTQETGICGLYAQYADSFKSILGAIRAPLADATSLVFPKDSGR